VCCGIYYFGLVRAYQSSDFTLVYPVVRALPVLLVAAGDVLLGRQPSAAGWGGMVLVTSGCLLAPHLSFRELDLRRYRRVVMLWIALAALGTVGYTLLDKSAAEVVRRGPATAARYGTVFFLVSCAVYGGLRLVFGGRRTDHGEVGWRVPALVACMNFGAYWLVLWAYQLARHASYVFAFRQFSIVIGVVFGFVLFREKGLAVRVTGTVLITLGLLLIGLWGR
jgi:drug/metabolite transporter (DMT)-like permease